MRQTLVPAKRPRIRGLIPKAFRRKIPKHVRFSILGTYRLVHELVVDYMDWVLDRRGELTPPRHLVLASRIGGGVPDFRAAGLENFRCIIELANLKPYETVLEVGCGIGRMAVPLTRYLDQSGKYEGFDIIPISIGWCQKKITPRYPNFRFRLADVYSGLYNPKGRFKSSEYKFPYSDESFDFVFLFSVFTHMIPQDFEHYLAEIARVLKTGKRCMITFLLLNPESSRLIDSGLSPYDLKYESGPSRFIDKDAPESTIAYEEEYVRSVYQRSGLSITEPIRYGSWPGRRNFFSGQDIVMARKIRAGGTRALSL